MYIYIYTHTSDLICMYACMHTCMSLCMYILKSYPLLVAKSNSTIAIMRPDSNLRHGFAFREALLLAPTNVGIEATPWLKSLRKGSFKFGGLVSMFLGIHECSVWFSKT